MIPLLYITLLARNIEALKNRVAEFLYAEAQPRGPPLTLLYAIFDGKGSHFVYKV